MPELLAAAQGASLAFAPALAHWQASEGAPPLARAAHLDALTYLADDILVKVDRASMAVALEVRAPFLARAVVEYAFSLPDAFRMRGLTGKRVLRDAVHDLLPPPPRYCGGPEGIRNPGGRLAEWSIAPACG